MHPQIRNITNPFISFLTGRYFISVIIFLITMKLTSMFALSDFSKIDITLTTDQDSYAQLYYTGGRVNNNFSEKSSVKEYYESSLVNEEITFSVGDRYITNLRVDPGNKAGNYSISKIVLHNHFGPSTVLLPNDASLTVHTDQHSQLTSSDSVWQITATNDDPYIIINGDFSNENHFFHYGLPAIIAICCFILFPSNLRQINFNELTCLKDVSSKNPSSGQNLDALDGVRGLAAIMVLGDHTGAPFFDGLGLVGVVIFFSLSGFLLTMPFAKNPALISDMSYVKSYFARRLKRILPMFFFVCFAGFIFQAKLDSFFQSILFIKARGVHWTIQQEIYFYMLLPFFIALCHYVLKGKIWLCSIVLLILAYLFNHHHIPVMKIYGLGTMIPLYVGIFLSGMAMCYAFQLPQINQNKLLKRIIENPIVSILLLIIILRSQNLPWISTSSKFWIFSGNFPIFIGASLLLIALTSNSIISKFFNFYPLRAIGIVGYSFYLLHPIILINCKEFFLRYLGITPPNTVMFMVTLVLTYLASATTYTYIEKPFLIHKKSRTLLSEETIRS